MGARLFGALAEGFGVDSVSRGRLLGFHRAFAHLRVLGALARGPCFFFFFGGGGLEAFRVLGLTKGFRV